MARNPYAGLSTATDLYTNGNGYAEPEPAPAADYDPYGERYGTPPIPAARDVRRAPARTDGYGGFGDESNGPSPAVRPQEQYSRQEGYGQRVVVDQPAPTRSPRRPAAIDGANARSYRSQRSEGSADSGNRGPPSYGRPSERLNPNGNASSIENVTPPAPRNRGNGIYGRSGGGDGTRQIEGQSTSIFLACFAPAWRCILRDHDKWAFTSSHKHARCLILIQFLQVGGAEHSGKPELIRFLFRSIQRFCNTYNQNGLLWVKTSACRYR